MAQTQAIRAPELTLPTETSGNKPQEVKVVVEHRHTDHRSAALVPQSQGTMVSFGTVRQVISIATFIGSVYLLFAGGRYVHHRATSDDWNIFSMSWGMTKWLFSVASEVQNAGTAGSTELVPSGYEFPQQDWGEYFKSFNVEHLKSFNPLKDWQGIAEVVAASMATIAATVGYKVFVQPPLQIAASSATVVASTGVSVTRLALTGVAAAGGAAWGATKWGGKNLGRGLKYVFTSRVANRFIPGAR